MAYLMGIDFGGSSSKLTLIDISGEVIWESSVEYPTYYPYLRWCEQRPEDWENALSQNIKKLLEVKEIDPADIIAIAIDSATHTNVLCDENFNPLRPAIYWTDSRSVLQVERLKKEYGTLILEQCFHCPDTIWTLPQLLWVKENEPDIFESCAISFLKRIIFVIS